jgi:hypothetical protein
VSYESQQSGISPEKADPVIFGAAAGLFLVQKQSSLQALSYREHLPAMVLYNKKTKPCFDFAPSLMTRTDGSLRSGFSPIPPEIGLNIATKGYLRERGVVLRFI